MGVGRRRGKTIKILNQENKNKTNQKKEKKYNKKATFPREFAKGERRISADVIRRTRTYTCYF